MVVAKDERDRILHMIESGQVSAVEASQLLDTLEIEPDLSQEYSHTKEWRRERTLRVRTSNLKSRQQRVYVTATVPISVLKAGLRLGAQFIPQLQTNALADLLHSIERGTTGRLLDVQDLDKGERIEVFVD
ncbi:MAG TPA: hypothetical protein VL485_22735 [Ktedonobacteraceae bacterium]|jgi:hypothetical protein|nr:hypothetical protein [Ktedonobacteraceae bacterium]